MDWLVDNLGLAAALHDCDKEPTKTLHLGGADRICS